MTRSTSAIGLKANKATKVQKRPAREPRPPLTDSERHARFVEAAKKAEADDSPQAFDRAFAKVATPTKS